MVDALAITLVERLTADGPGCRSAIGRMIPVAHSVPAVANVTFVRVIISFEK